MTTIHRHRRHNADLKTTFIAEPAHGSSITRPIVPEAMIVAHQQVVHPESREQYLRYAVSIWEASMQQGMREPTGAIAALEVLCLIFDEQ